MTQLWRTFNQVIPYFAVIIPFLILIGWAVYRRLRKKEKKKKEALYLASVNIFLALSSISIIMVTLLPRPYEGRTLQIIPFFSMWDNIVNFIHYTDLIRNLGFNILLFIPFGLFLCLKLPSCKLMKITYIGMIFSICIEIAQFILSIGRITNIDDVILNTLGTFIGAFMGMYIREKIIKFQFK
ncbi:VanZ like family protein [Pelagirhabdus alkalitolerans]|uniref:VanZ like family protein n=1 Tax=Pelagirhabdus alkalitolerans TaxID=1612202 RepID=A0A1G6N0G4_9BACI|nr:VanZ family protein [Pelagirhabdus alkalitolerans]SDC61312.1 VanZ like family protein [Pelagirhabdus alkalitolerans]